MPTEHVWIFDAVLCSAAKDRPLTHEHFAEFEKCFGDNPHGQSPRKRQIVKKKDGKGFQLVVKEKNYKLDGFKWIKDEDLDDPENLPEPEELLTDNV